MFCLRRHLAAALIPKKLRGRSWTSYLLSKEEGERNLSELSIKCLSSVIPLRNQSLLKTGFPSILISELYHRGDDRNCSFVVTLSSKKTSDQIARSSLTKGSDTLIKLLVSILFKFPPKNRFTTIFFKFLVKEKLPMTTVFVIQVLLHPNSFERFIERYYVNHLDSSFRVVIYHDIFFYFIYFLAPQKFVA